MIGIISYNAGNLASMQNALDRLRADYFLSNKSKELEKADKIIFPGVGHARAAMESLQTQNLDKFLQSWERPLLGVCLGMQLLLDFSEEGETTCLGLIPGQIKKFDSNKIKIIPHMGWNQVFSSAEKLPSHLEGQDFYFVHSYFAEPKNKEDVWMNSIYQDFSFATAVKKGNIWGTQFHPEKSGKAGEAVLQMFLDL